jgi:hypothetical protein
VCRIKVKFHCDRRSAADENSSCRVRVAQASAGAGSDHLFLPPVAKLNSEELYARAETHERRDPKR